MRDTMLIERRDTQLRLLRTDAPDGYPGALEVGWEPSCAKCGEPIRWVLDMFSFSPVRGGHALCRARCVWKPEAFMREAGLQAEDGTATNQGE